MVITNTVIPSSKVILMTLTLKQARSLHDVAARYKVELAALVAVINVESGGQIFATDVDANAPVIRWEGHYFYRLLKGADRTEAVLQGLAAERAGAVKNPRSQKARYDILEAGMQIDRDAALSSISIGVGQVMGSHWQSLGFSSPRAMFEFAESGLAGQVEIMLRYINKFDLKDEMERHDWSGFARGYNGPAYAKHGYHTKLARAYGEALNLLNVDAAEPAKSAHTMLRLGSRGARVRELQQLLRRAGYAITIDGDFGPATKTAVKAFQKANMLQVDGVVGPKTFDMLQDFKTSPGEVLGQTPAAEIPETTSGTVGAGSGVGIAIVADKINEVADKIGSTSETFAMISSGLYVVAGLLVVGGIAWAAWGYVKSKQTYEGV